MIRENWKKVITITDEMIGEGYYAKDNVGNTYTVLWDENKEFPHKVVNENGHRVTDFLLRDEWGILCSYYEVEIIRQFGEIPDELEQLERPSRDSLFAA